MNVVIIGGSGLLGRKISEVAIQKGYKTYSTYNSHHSVFGIPVKLDICRKELVIKKFKDIKPDVVIHVAGLTDVDKCEVNKEIAFNVNVIGTRNVVQQAGIHNSFLIYVSTDYVFSGEKGSYIERDIPNPINYYGYTKLMGEYEVKKSEMEWCIIRPSVIYGSEPIFGKHNFALWIVDQLLNNKKVNIITNQIVSPTLNTNLANMMLEIMERKLAGIYHCAGATYLSRYEFAKHIANSLDLNRELINPTSSRPMSWIAKRPVNSSLNVNKASNLLINKPLKIIDALQLLKKELFDSFKRHQARK